MSERELPGLKFRKPVKPYDADIRWIKRTAHGTEIGVDRVPLVESKRQAIVKYAKRFPGRRVTHVDLVPR